MAARTTLRGPLSRAEIITAALDLAESDGLEKLSLHRIAAAVGVKTTSLYHHVTDKSDVLDAMADHVLESVVIPDIDAMDWPEAVRATSYAFRTAAMRYPNSAPLVLVRRPNRPALLPIVDLALRTLRRAGLERSLAVHVMRAHIAFLVGSLLRESGTTANGSAATTVAGPHADLLSAGLPAVAESAAELASCDHDAEFEFGLDLLVSSVRQRLGARTDPPVG
jgi:TetR/AcrR family tetracycline transcriptional repressor